MSLVTPETVEKLQTTLHAKAKESPSYRFYSLYDKVYRLDVLWHAYRICRANDGAPGVDGATFDDIEAYGVMKWLRELAEELQTKSYRPEAVRRVLIPKPGQPGRFRPLGIPTIKDRVAMTAAMLVLEPIFESDLQPEQYAYRSNRSALDAVQHVVSLLKDRHWQVVDADLSGYFDAIPHSDLLKSIARRVSDGKVLHLIKMWLQAPIEETDDRGRKRRTTGNKDAGRGTPQGSPISPLFSNIYMRRFILGWKVLGHERHFNAKIVNYADDMVICCRGRAEEMNEFQTPCFFGKSWYSRPLALQALGDVTELLQSAQTSPITRVSDFPLITPITRVSDFPCLTPITRVSDFPLSDFPLLR